MSELKLKLNNLACWLGADDEPHRVELVLEAIREIESFEKQLEKIKAMPNSFAIVRNGRIQKDMSDNQLEVYETFEDALEITTKRSEIFTVKIINANTIGG